MTPIHDLPVETPAYVFDESRILGMAGLLDQARRICGCRMLYSIKALPLGAVLERLSAWMDGFSVSSLFEARLASSSGLPLHITTPGIRAGEIAEIADLCDFVAFNSLEQFHRLQPLLGHRASLGLRVNPGLSFLDDRRYDPCRPSSKLGVPLDELQRALAKDEALNERIEGLHFHTLFSSRSFEPMRKTVELIEESLGAPFLSRLDWINLGGGYLFESLEDLAGLVAIASNLRQRFGVEVYFEPGKALVGRAGYLIASVIDLFRRDGNTVAVLDTTVNHHPETFEFQVRPRPAWLEPQQGERVILAGCTCLAGDVFGEYRLARSPKVGDRLAFADVGAYSLVKANRFNGHNLPSVYLWDGAGEPRLVKRHGFAEYQAQWVADEADRGGYDTPPWHGRG